MGMRVAKGTELPNDWQPGQPLTVGRAATLPAIPPTGCPFGPECYSCRNGLQWNSEQGKHSGHRINARRRATRKTGPSQRSA